MKNKIVLMAVIAIAFASCKKEECPKPEVIKENVYVTKTDTITNTDTVYVVSQSLIGLWKLYKIENVNNGSSTFSSSQTLAEFTSSQMKSDYNADGVYDNIYSVVYGTGYVDVYQTATPYTYAISTSGAEYRLTRQISSTQSQIWYLKK